MCRILQFFVVFVLILHNFDHVNGEEYQCDSDYPNWCYLKDLKITRNNFEIVPVAANLSDFIIIRLHGTVPVLSATEICKAMPNLKDFQSDSISLEEILEEAFENCNKLEELYLRGNKIFKIGRNSFKGLSNLERLSISGGNLPTFDTDLTDLKKLTYLRLNHLKIVNFLAEILREQTNLKRLSINSNNLFDLNIEEIIKNKPNLEEISLDNNNFKCSRLTEILNLLKDKNIEAPPSSYKKRVRSYTPNEIDEIMCLTDEQWESEFNKLPLEQQLLHNQEMDIKKPKLTSLIIEKVEILDKNQQESVLSLETKLNNAVKTMCNQTEQSEDLISHQTQMESKLGVLEEKISKVTETFETITNKLEAKQKEDLKADGQITEITKSLEKINAKIDAQDAINLKMQENMNKFMETLSNILVTQSSINNMIDQKIKSLKDQLKETV